MLKGMGGGLKVEEERVTVGHIVVQLVWDHEEWTRLVRVAEGRDLRRPGIRGARAKKGGYVTDPFEVEGALAVVAERKGWLLTDVGGPLVSGKETSDADGASNPAEEDSR